MTSPIIHTVQVNRGHDILRCYHAVLASYKAAQRAEAMGEDDLKRLYLDQACWRIEMALHYSCQEPVITRHKCAFS